MQGHYKKVTNGLGKEFIWAILLQKKRQTHAQIKKNWHQSRGKKCIFFVLEVKRGIKGQMCIF